VRILEDGLEGQQTPFYEEMRARPRIGAPALCSFGVGGHD
jgi:hypothetical protein